MDVLFLVVIHHNVKCFPFVNSNKTSVNQLQVAQPLIILQVVHQRAYIKLVWIVGGIMVQKNVSIYHPQHVHRYLETRNLIVPILVVGILRDFTVHIHQKLLLVQVSPMDHAVYFKLMDNNVNQILKEAVNWKLLIVTSKHLYHFPIKHQWFLR